MTIWLLLPAVVLGVVLGAYIERYRWISWAKRTHPDELDTTWL